jgi:hypothetical protein
MRRGEILILKWKNVELINCVIHVEESLARSKARGLYVKEVKTSLSEHDMYIFACVLNVLAKYKQHQERKDYGFVISSNNRNYLKPRSYFVNLKNLRRKQTF